MHLMLDFETLDILPTALPLTLGMVWFDPTKSDVEQDPDNLLGIRFDFENLRRIGGFTESPATHSWWNQQSQAVREEAFLGPRTNVFLAAGQITGFMMRHPLDGLWGNGAAFDNAVLRHFLARIRAELIRRDGYSSLPDGLPPFRTDRCYRTLRSMYVDLGYTLSVAFEGEEHDALADAVYQARCAQVMMQALGVYQ